MENIVVVHSVMSDCDPMDCSMQGFLVLYYLLEFVQTHVHWVGNVIQQSYFLWPLSLLALSFPAPGSLPMKQLFMSGGQIIGASASASILPMNIKGWFPLGLTGLISLLSKELSRVFSSTTIQTLSFHKEGTTFISVLDYWKNHSFDYTDLCQQNDISAF